MPGIGFVYGNPVLDKGTRVLTQDGTINNKNGSILAENKLDIPSSLIDFDKFGNSWETNEYLKNNVIDNDDINTEINDNYVYFEVKNISKDDWINYFSKNIQNNLYIKIKQNNPENDNYNFYNKYISLDRFIKDSGVFNVKLFKTIYSKLREYNINNPIYFKENTENDYLNENFTHSMVFDSIEKTNTNSWAYNYNGNDNTYNIIPRDNSMNKSYMDEQNIHSNLCKYVINLPENQDKQWDVSRIIFPIEISTLINGIRQISWNTEPPDLLTVTDISAELIIEKSFNDNSNIRIFQGNVFYNVFDNNNYTDDNNTIFNELKNIKPALNIDFTSDKTNIPSESERFTEFMNKNYKIKYDTNLPISYKKEMLTNLINDIVLESNNPNTFIHIHPTNDINDLDNSNNILNEGFINYINSFNQNTLWDISENISTTISTTIGISSEKIKNLLISGDISYNTKLRIHDNNTLDNKTVYNLANIIFSPKQFKYYIINKNDIESNIEIPINSFIKDNDSSQIYCLKSESNNQKQSFEITLKYPTSEQNNNDTTDDNNPIYIRKNGILRITPNEHLYRLRDKNNNELVSGFQKNILKLLDNREDDEYKKITLKIMNISKNNDSFTAIFNKNNISNGDISNNYNIYFEVFDFQIQDISFVKIPIISVVKSNDTNPMYTFNLNVSNVKHYYIQQNNSIIITNNISVNDADNESYYINDAGWENDYYPGTRIKIYTNNDGYKNRGFFTKTIVNILNEYKPFGHMDYDNVNELILESSGNEMNASFKNNFFMNINTLETNMISTDHTTFKQISKFGDISLNTSFNAIFIGNNHNIASYGGNKNFVGWGHNHYKQLKKVNNRIINDLSDIPIISHSKLSLQKDNTLIIDHLNNIYVRGAYNNKIYTDNEKLFNLNENKYEYFVKNTINHSDIYDLNGENAYFQKSVNNLHNINIFSFKYGKLQYINTEQFETDEYEYDCYFDKSNKYLHERNNHIENNANVIKDFIIFNAIINNGSIKITHTQSNNEQIFTMDVDNTNIVIEYELYIPSSITIQSSNAIYTYNIIDTPVFERIDISYINTENENVTKTYISNFENYSFYNDISFSDISKNNIDIDISFDNTFKDIYLFNKHLKLNVYNIDTKSEEMDQILTEYEIMDNSTIVMNNMDTIEAIQDENVLSACHNYYNIFRNYMIYLKPLPINVVTYTDIIATDIINTIDIYNVHNNLYEKIDISSNGVYSIYSDKILIDLTTNQEFTLYDKDYTKSDIIFSMTYESNTTPETNTKTLYYMFEENNAFDTVIDYNGKTYTLTDISINVYKYKYFINDVDFDAENISMLNNGYTDPIIDSSNISIEKKTPLTDITLINNNINNILDIDQNNISLVEIPFVDLSQDIHLQIKVIPNDINMCMVKITQIYSLNKNNGFNNCYSEYKDVSNGTIKIDLIDYFQFKYQKIHVDIILLNNNGTRLQKTYIYPIDIQLTGVFNDLSLNTTLDTKTYSIYPEIEDIDDINTYNYNINVANNIFAEYEHGSSNTSIITNNISISTNDIDISINTCEVDFSKNILKQTILGLEKNKHDTDKNTIEYNITNGENNMLLIEISKFNIRGYFYYLLSSNKDTDLNIALRKNENIHNYYPSFSKGNTNYNAYVHMPAIDSSHNLDIYIYNVKNSNLSWIYRDIQVDTSPSNILINNTYNITFTPLRPIYLNVSTSSMEIFIWTTYKTTPTRY